MQHLSTFGRLKGVTDEDILAVAEESISAVGLTEKRHVLSSSLSGGQKRKLSLSMALIGGSRAIFLDEPTSGMDPYSRRSTWNMLQVRERWFSCMFLCVLNCGLGGRRRGQVG